MTPRPYVLLSVAMSIDGYIDDSARERLILSNDADLDRVDEVRAGADAILVGANTLRRDNPRLLVNSARRRAARVERGLSPYPVKAVVTGGGNGVEPGLRFFQSGGEKIVYTAGTAHAALSARFDGVADVVDAGAPLSYHRLLADLAARGVRRLMVEGGGRTHTHFLAQDLVDEVHLAIAPFFVGDRDAPRFTYPTGFPQGPSRRMTVAETRQVGDVVLLRYLVRAGS